MKFNKLVVSTIYLSFFFLLFSGCKKYLEIAPPISTITTVEVFENNRQAEWAMSGVYSKMINGIEATRVNTAAERCFAAGLATLAGSLSSDDVRATSVMNPVLQNKLTLTNSSLTNEIWKSAYNLIYGANGVIEGIEDSKSGNLQDSVRKQLTGEALTMRAFAYFYLVNFFGDVPLALTTDFNVTVKLSRAKVNKVYEQLIKDLVKAKGMLSDNFKVGNNERVRVTKWFAEAMLARVYLYVGDYQNAINSATTVINQNSLFFIEPNLTDAFLKNNNEAIFQLKQTNENSSLKNATPEGYLFQFTPSGPNVVPGYFLTEELANAFEVNDKRKLNWTADHKGYLAVAKYKIGRLNSAFGGTQTEYYTVMRLAELHLIRAEAKLLLSETNKDEAIADLNVLRKRANVIELPTTLTAAEVTVAIEHERRVEFFAEWGHRWFDLKRTGRANEVLSKLSYKSPWWGDYQLVYPIPVSEISNNSFLIQNKDYTK